VARLRLPVFVVLLALVLAACASPSGPAGAQAGPTAAPATATTAPAMTPTTAATATAMAAVTPSTAANAATTPAATTPAAAPTATPDPNATIKMVEDPKLGTILTDNKGMTLYYYTKDQANVSNCYDQCATNWPPVLVTSGQPVWPAGLPGALSTISRKDGAKQATYSGMPLYTFAKDTKAGDMTGQGVGNVWYIAKPGQLFVPNGETALKVTTDSKLGQILTDSNGWVLYYYTKDAPNATNCYGTCAKNWPPFVVALGDTKLPTGVPGTLGTIDRTDGTKIVTYNGMPLYYWVKDLKAGDTTGQNVGKVWYVVPPSDKPADNFPTAGASTNPAPAAATPTPATKTKSGY